MNIHNGVLFLIWSLAVSLGGALAHEQDIAKNCAKSGDANAWRFEITCSPLASRELEMP